MPRYAVMQQQRQGRRLLALNMDINNAGFKILSKMALSFFEEGYAFDVFIRPQGHTHTHTVKQNFFFFFNSTGHL